MFPLTYRELLSLSRDFFRHRRLRTKPIETQGEPGMSRGDHPPIFEPGSAKASCGDEITSSMIRYDLTPVSVTRGCTMRVSSTRRFLLTAFALLAMLPASARAAQTTLDVLLAGGDIVSGDKRFYGFENYLQSGDMNINPATIDVFTISTLQPDGTIEYGIRFQRAAGWELNGANKLYDMSLDFLVTATDPNKLISDNTLEITGNHIGGGEAHLVEGVVDFQTGATLANKEVYINIGDTGVDKLIDHQVFTSFVKTIRVSKDFQLQTRNSPNDNIFVSHFDQTFSQVPEPTSVILMGIGIVGVAGLRIRNRLARKVD